MNIRKGDWVMLKDDHTLQGRVVGFTFEVADGAQDSCHLAWIKWRGFKYPFYPADLRVVRR